MNKLDYVCDGQMNIFDFLTIPQKNVFNPLEAIAFEGSGFENGKQRIYNFFTQDNSLKEKTSFLKKEYGIGGYGKQRKQPNFIHHFSHGIFGHDLKIEYYDENEEKKLLYATFTELANVITTMIAENRYMSA